MSQMGTFFDASALGGVLTLTGDAGGAIAPDGAGDITIAGGTNIGTVGAGNTITINLDGTITLTRVNATTFDTNVAAAGVTLAGVSLIADGTDANIPINLTAKGTGKVVASTGLTATTGDVTISSGNLTLPNTTNTPTGMIMLGGAAVGNRFIHNYGTENTFVGTIAGNVTLTTGSAIRNTGCGYESLEQLTTGEKNSCFGRGTGNDIDTGSNNCFFGDQSGFHTDSGSSNCGFGEAALQSVHNCIGNSAFGKQALDAIGLDAHYNCAFGYLAATAYTSNESDNICIMNIGTIGDNNKLIIGTQGAGDGQQNTCWIAGIYNTAPGGGSDNVVVIDSTGQLGAQASLDVANGGSGAATLLDHGVLVGSGVGAITPLTVGTDGQVLIGDSANDPVFASLTSTGGSIAYTAGAGTLNLESTGGGLSWSEETGGTVALVAHSGYILNNAGVLVATLPATAAVGSVIDIVGKGAGGWSVAQRAGQTIHFIASDTTPGVGGSLASTVRYDCISLVCTTADTDFCVRSSVGNITIV